jgi:hypothetical protein
VAKDNKRFGEGGRIEDPLQAFPHHKNVLQK